MNVAHVIEVLEEEIEKEMVSSCCAGNVYAIPNKPAKCLTCFEECEVVTVESAYGIE